MIATSRCMSLISLSLGSDLSSEAVWTFHLIGHVGDASTSYRPRSDYLFQVNGYPILLVEVQSSPNEEDRCRMLTQAGVLVRVMNLVKRKNRDSFVAMAVYVSASWEAERYFVYQPDRDSREVRVANILVLGLRSSSLLAD